MKLSIKTALMSLLFASFAFGLSACDNKGPAEKAGAQVDETMSDAADAVDDAATDAGNAIEDACEEIKEGADAKNTNC